ncbi:hypothetical protein [Clostridium pasteurianum]|uniref:Uncharacterized protein n=1 Tax=Clostridium pasteurianum BC1 TaxID=86416 RepID=R4K8T4_CLOPA|nr:hypothetical protein [Clostridium pasteurianum]AGK98111.1 hypothetical protein Clopa_3310 [Clostridium pasteurianum BC1]
MESEQKTKAKKSKKVVSSIVLYSAAIFVALIGIALLIDNVILYRSAVSQYIAQGYSVTTVEQQLIPSQLLPSIFNSVGIYGGMAFILAGVGIVNTKLSKHLVKNKDVNKESTLEIDTIQEEKTKDDENAEVI